MKFMNREAQEVRDAYLLAGRCHHSIFSRLISVNTNDKHE